MQPLTVGEMISVHRKRRGLTQVQLAKMVGVSAPYISQLEHDHRDPTVALLKRICEALKITLNITLE